jgi:hypothetical protein
MILVPDSVPKPPKTKNRRPNSAKITQAHRRLASKKTSGTLPKPKLDVEAVEAFTNSKIKEEMTNH